jgi:chromosome segregation ATPase
MVEWERKSYDYKTVTRKRGTFVVKEYIQQKKERTETALSEKKEMLKKLQETEKIIYENIQRIRQSDIDFEIFSPRTGEKTLRDEIVEMEQKLGKIKTQKADVQETISELKIKIGNFEEMLKELEKHYR